MVAAVTVRQNGFAEMAFVGEKAWHGLGQELQEGADIETWKRAAGMDWKIQRSKVRYFADREGCQQLEMPTQHVLFRSDSKIPLGIVSDGYKVVQPGEVLEFFRDLTAASGYTLNTAGTLFDGKRFWALAKVGENAAVVGEDMVGGYLLLSTSCDGSMATTAKFTTIRVVCNNTLSMALRAKDRKTVTISHRSKFDAGSVKDELGLARGQFKDFLEGARALSAKRVTNAGAEDFVARVLVASGVKHTDEKPVQGTKGFVRIMELFKGSAMGGTLVSAEGTQWGLVNAVTEYVDHHARAQSDSNRLNSAWFGVGDALKSTAFEMALAS